MLSNFSRLQFQCFSNLYSNYKSALITILTYVTDIATLNVMIAEVMRPPTKDLSPQVLRPEILTPSTYSHPLQERIASEWRPLLLENGEGCPARRVEVFRTALDKFGNFINTLSPSQIDGDMDQDTSDLIARKASYVKSAAIDIATSLRLDVGTFVEYKTMHTMQIKYPPDSVYGLVRAGVHPLDAMALHKKAHNEGRVVIPQRFQMTDEEAEYRMPRNPAFADPHQDVADTWQRGAYGKYLRASDRLPNVFGEGQELLDEFDGMTPEEINNLVENNHIITFDTDSGISSQISKLKAIGGESGDVVTGIDGFTAGLNRDQAIDANSALDRQISRYRKTKKLVRIGFSESEAIRLQHEIEDRRRRGLSLPFINIPAAVSILIG